MKCVADDCDREADRSELCFMHYARLRRRGSLKLPTRPLVKCKADGCEERTNRPHGFCLKHYKQDHYLRSVGRTELLERTSQERWINVDTGYVMVKQDGKLTYEHRVLAEKALGKPLPHGAVVHHTGARDDNHGYCKLVICPDQSYHLLLHKRMEELGYAQD